MGDNGFNPSDFDPSLADNKAEYQASKDAKSESAKESNASWSRAKDSADSFWDSIFGGKKK